MLDGGSAAAMQVVREIKRVGSSHAVITYCNPGKSTTMRYWWVSQNQTFRHELAGGYLWSPKRNSNGARNPFYESMREVAPGDLIFSFMDTRILALAPSKEGATQDRRRM